MSEQEPSNREILYHQIVFYINKMQKQHGCSADFSIANVRSIIKEIDDAGFDF